MKEKQDILVHLEGTGHDLAALEAMYHHSCYMRLTKYLAKPQKELQPESLHYTQSYNVFCDNHIKPMLLCSPYFVQKNNTQIIPKGPFTNTDVKNIQGPLFGPRQL